MPSLPRTNTSHYRPDNVTGRGSSGHLALHSSPALMVLCLGRGWLTIHLSSEKRAPGCLGCIGDDTTQLYGDFDKPS